MQFSGVVIVCMLIMVPLAACGGPVQTQTPTTNTSGIHKIKHIVVIMQENRSLILRH
jgi:phospholipase C